jgi:hypothetical protein
VRPFCGPCRLHNLVCHYEVEPGTTRGVSLKRKHDAALIELAEMRRIYEALRNSTVDEANDIVQQIRQSFGSRELLPTPAASGSDLESIASWKRHNTYGTATSHYHDSPASSDHFLRPSDQSDLRHDEHPEQKSEQKSYPHLSVSHKVLLWPVVFRRIHVSGTTEAVSDLRYFGTLGTPWLLEKDTSDHLQSLPCDVGLECLALDSSSRSGFFPSLTIQRVGELCAAYFSTFNTMFPLLILDDFKNNVVAKLLVHGYRDEDPESVLALLVFALGQLAIEGVFNSPADTGGGISGVPGNPERPPGLDIFNEARRRIGILATQRTLTNVQIMLLQATYFEACARHADFWSSVTAASVACKYLIRGRPTDWSSMQGDLIKRAYWVCVLHERMLDIDLRISSTGIEDLEDQVPLPHFHELKPRAHRMAETPPGTGQPIDTVERHDYAYHFSALITLSRLLRRADDLIHGCESFVEENEPLWQEPTTQNRTGDTVDITNSDKYKEPPPHMIEELTSQLQSWRATLPARLHWNDGDKFDFRAARGQNPPGQQSIFNRQSPIGSPREPGYDIDMAVAHLRTRFYHTQFLINRPFVYKALHVPELMTPDDRIKCSYAIKTACTWPLYLTPPICGKHLVPHLFAWTQNFMAMLCILRLCQRDVFLGEICREGGIKREEMQRSSSLMVEWLEDVRQVDGIADWSIRILEPLL